LVCQSVGNLIEQVAQLEHVSVGQAHGDVVLDHTLEPGKMRSGHCSFSPRRSIDSRRSPAPSVHPSVLGPSRYPAAECDNESLAERVNNSARPASGHRSCRLRAGIGPELTNHTIRWFPTIPRRRCLRVNACSSHRSLSWQRRRLGSRPPGPG